MPTCLIELFIVLPSTGNSTVTPLFCVILVMYLSGTSASMYILFRFKILKTSEPCPGAITVPASFRTSSITPEKGALIDAFDC